ncbi:M1 family metallopeptidase [Streptomyces sp. SHP 1-2]|uniref:M1 family metallopeptidase n=1 Tax=Streptomyces sp. SHP 1-2 TaxID=2769489 RepID=UPI002237A895|nr:M1 family metallopeptidase [Streptomyces sp. SHP 1-2]MCW5250777.1 M1 family metallopeptidase [Streptomyces sp. SHP 1-2]
MRPARPLAAAVALAAVAALGGCGGVRGGPGGPGLGDPYFPRAGNGGYDVRHYGLDLAYDPSAARFKGTAVITARATRDLSAFNLDLKGLRVEEVTVQDRPARWNRAGQELTVRPADDLDRDTVFRVTVRYSGRPETITDPDGSEEGWLPTADGAVGLGEPTGSMAWYPGNHHPSDKAAYDIAVTVPEGLGVVSNGEPAGTSTRDGRTTSRWRVTEPMASHVATVAIGRWRVLRSTTADGLPVHTAVDPEQEAASRAVLARLPEIVEWGREVFGPYPFASTGVIVDRPGDSGYALETQNRPYFPGAPDLSTLVHELAHQWYGNSVTPRSWRDMWLNEGFATYAEWLWAEDHGGATAEETFRARYDGARSDGDAEAARAVWAFPPAEPGSAAHISDSPVYQRGAMVLHRVRRTVGDDGAFRALLRGWAAAHRHGNADTAAFTAYVERTVPGKDFTEVWDDWLYGEGRPPAP